MFPRNHDVHGLLSFMGSSNNSYLQWWGFQKHENYQTNALNLCHRPRYLCTIHQSILQSRVDVELCYCQYLFFTRRGLLGMLDYPFNIITFGIYFSFLFKQELDTPYRVPV